MQFIDISYFTFMDIFEGLPGGGFHDSSTSPVRLDALYPTVSLNPRYRTKPRSQNLLTFGGNGPIF